MSLLSNLEIQNTRVLRLYRINSHLAEYTLHVYFVGNE